MNSVFTLFLALNFCLVFLPLIFAKPQRGTPLGRRPLYRHEDSGKLFVHEERSGYNNIAQDWWQEVQLVTSDRAEHVGHWFKYNVGYYPKNSSDTSPFVLLSAKERSKLPVPAPADSSALTWC